MASNQKNPALVIALGASAGGLAALQEFFAAVAPEPSGFAFVVVQHLSPDHKSLMSELLGRITKMPIKGIEDGDRLEGDTVYLNPPACYLNCVKGVLRISQRENHPHLPIDHFLSSLAEDFHDRSVAIILSGTGSDGARGLLAVKEAGGLVMVQEESTAEYAGMSQAAMATGGVDFVLPPAQLARELKEYHQHRSLLSPSETAVGPSNDQLAVLAALRDKVDSDFSQYKKETLLRRIQRRMAVRQINDMASYATLVREDAQEARLLLRDFLIGVTSFFRNPNAFLGLAERVIPTLLEGAPEEAIRAWVPGCSTGEEVYSIVILFLEEAARQGRELQLKIFATDLDREALKTASKGWYPESIAEDISPERLQRFFVAQHGGFQVNSSVRSHVIFSVHNLVKDPPFTNLDLLSCRNLLVYFEPDLQKLALGYLHFSLKLNRYLFLGSSEVIAQTDENMFSSIHLKSKLFQKQSASPSPHRRATESLLRRPEELGEQKTDVTLAVDAAYRSLLEEYCPAAIVVDPSGKLVHILVAADRYLKTYPGSARLDVSSLLSARLGAVVASAITRTLGPAGGNGMEGEEVSELVMPIEDSEDFVGVKVWPLIDSQGQRAHAMVTFREIHSSAPLKGNNVNVGAINDAAHVQLLELRQEIQIARENFQTTVEELETNNEMLQAANEELLASGQEFETTSEQMRHELAMANQELLVLTSEHHGRIEELIGFHRDMEIFLNSNRQAVLFLDEQLNILRSTPNVTQYINVLLRDVGRPVRHLSLNFSDPQFVGDAQKVVDDGKAIERDLRLLGKKEKFHLSLYPYPCKPDKRGVVVTFTESIKDRDPVIVQSLLDTFQDPVGLLSANGILNYVNQAWCRLSQASIPGSPNGWLGCNFPDLLREWGEDARLALNGLESFLRGQDETLCCDYSRPFQGHIQTYQLGLRRVSSATTEVRLTSREAPASL